MVISFTNDRLPVVFFGKEFLLLYSKWFKIT